MNLADIYDIVASRLRLLLPCLAIALAFAIAYIVLTPSRYSATMSILIDPRERAPIGSDAQPMPQTPDIGLVESQMRVLTSRAVLRRVVESADLVDDPDFKPGALSLIVNSVKGLFRAASPQDRIDALAETLGEEISAKRSERTYVIDVEVRARSSEKAVALARALSAAYLQDQSSLADAIVDRQTAWLDGRLKELRGRVEQAERRVQDYRNENALALSDGRLSPEQQLTAANAALVAARGKRAEVEARYGQLKAAMTKGASAESVDDAIHSSVIEKLRADYASLSRDEAYERTVLGPSHPTYLVTQAQLRATQAQISAELQRIFGATDRELKAARGAEQGAEQIVANAETMTNKLGDSRVALTDLEREAATLRASYEKTQSARENVRRDIVESPLAQLVDPPVAASARTSPRSMPALLIALAAGFNLWIVAALVADYRERERPVAPRGSAGWLAGPSRKTERAASGWFEVELPRLTSAPRRSRPASGWIAKSPDEVAAVEAMRAGGPYAVAVDALYERLAAQFSEQERAPRLAVTARERGAGASTLALSLALAGCAKGARVLLADCNAARPTLTALSEANEPARRKRDERLFRRDARSGGEVHILPCIEQDEDASEPHLEAPFDLTILDCGALDAAAYLVNRWDAAPSVLVVDTSGADDGLIASEIATAGLQDKCVGVVRRPRVEELRRRA